MHHGIASSILALSRNLGQALSMAVVTFIMTTETAKQPSYTDGVLAALHASFVILAVLCFLAVAASLARGHHQKKLDSGGISMKNNSLQPLRLRHFSVSPAAQPSRPSTSVLS